RPARRDRSRVLAAQTNDSLRPARDADRIRLTALSKSPPFQPRNGELSTFKIQHSTEPKALRHLSVGCSLLGVECSSSATAFWSPCALIKSWRLLRAPW